MVVQHVLADKLIQIYEKEAKRTEKEWVINSADQSLLFAEVAKEMGLSYLHEETDYHDFNSNFLIPRKYSQSGPGIAVGDLNEDGLEDIFIGGSMRRPATLFLQQNNEQFRQVLFKDKIEEDAGVLIFDADQDNDNDILCVSGSTEFGSNTKYYQSRFYRNYGKGKFILDSAALPVITSSGSCVIAADFDKDGDLDLFVGGRIVPNQYPLPAQSYLLRNNGAGRFEDVTAQLCPALQKAGMVTAALWTDVDNDSWIDLILVGEFMPISIYKNHAGSFKKNNIGDWNTSTVGWWNSLVGGDFDKDGDMDYVVGNLGWNSIFKASINESVSVYAKDYNGDGKIDPIMTRYIAGKEYPCHYRESLTEQISELKKKLNSYAVYGNKTFNDLMDKTSVKGAFVVHATEIHFTLLHKTRIV